MQRNQNTLVNQVSGVDGHLARKQYRYLIHPDASVETVNIAGSDLSKKKWCGGFAPKSELEPFIRTPKNKEKPMAILIYEIYNPSENKVEYSSAKYLEGPVTEIFTRDALSMMGRAELVEIIRGFGEDPDRKNDDWLRTKIYDLQHVPAIA